MTKVPDSSKTPLTDEELQQADGGTVLVDRKVLHDQRTLEMRKTCYKCGGDDFDIISREDRSDFFFYRIRCRQCGEILDYIPR